MKNFLFLFLISFLFIGCASKNGLNHGIVKSSNPIFITISPKSKSTYVKFTNTSSLDSNLTQAVEVDLANSGYDIVKDEKSADIILKGNLNYFRRMQFKDPDVFFNFGFGSGGWNHWGMGMGGPVFYDDYRTNSYIYDAQLSLLIRVRNGSEFNDYTTNLNYQSDKNINSKSTMNDIFNYKICEQIRGYLNNIQ